MKNLLLLISILTLLNNISIAMDDEVSALDSKFHHFSIEGEHEKMESKNDKVENYKFIYDVMQKKYDRDLVTRFIKASPSQEKLARETGISTATISKLKAPEKYGALEPSARRFWQWIKSKNIEALKRDLNLTERNIIDMASSLSLIDLSNYDIVYNELGEDICHASKSLENGKPHLVREVVSYLHRMKGTFKKLDLSYNIISDEGLLLLINELKEHDTLEEINLTKNKISDKGLQYLGDLLILNRLKKIDISQNYGPSDETIKILESSISQKRKTKLSIKINKTILAVGEVE